MPPIEKASDLVGANSAILSAAADGEISTGDAAALGSIVGNVAKAMEIASIEERLVKLEAAIEKNNGKQV